MFPKHFIYMSSIVFSCLLMRRLSTKDAKFSFVCVWGGGCKFDYKNHIHAPRMTAPTTDCFYRHLAPHSMNVLSS